MSHVKKHFSALAPSASMQIMAFSRRSAMTKKEIDALLSEVKSLADEAERQVKKKA